MKQPEKLEGYADIGDSIKDRRISERSFDQRCIGRVLPGVGRVLCTIETRSGLVFDKTLWITYEERHGLVPLKDTSYSDIRICRNHSLATDISIKGIGLYKDVPNIGGLSIKQIFVHDYATYTPSNEHYLARDLFVTIPDGITRQYFKFLPDLLVLNDRIKTIMIRKKELEQQAKLEEKRRAEEAAREEEHRNAEKEAKRREQEEAERIARENAQREKEKAEMERIERDLAESEAALQKALKDNHESSIMWHSEYEARETPGLNPQQEIARISHIYDGTPLIIEGGPGTGKTTVLVQRVDFLLSHAALETHKNNLSRAQREKLYDDKNVDRHWLFLAPNQLLLNYLKNSMVSIGLRPNEDLNTKTIDSFRSEMMLEYKFTDPSKKGPFLEYKPSKADKERRLILKPFEVIEEFKKFFVTNIKDVLIKLSNMNTSKYSWNEKAVVIRAYCKSSETRVNSMTALMQLFFELQYKIGPSITQYDNQLKQEVNRFANIIKKSIVDDPVAFGKVSALLKEWQNVAIVNENAEANALELDEQIDEEDYSAVRNVELELALFSHLRRLLPKIALKPLMPTTISEREQKLYALIEKHITSCNLEKMGELKLFVKLFSQLCKGVEANIFGQIVRIYKVYRKSLLDSRTDLYDLSFLEQIIKKDSNKRLHIDEEDLLLGFANNMMHTLYKSFPIQFAELKNQSYINAYKDNAKYVIAVDEATDYSVLDYYMIASFRHYEVSSISLCGDLMQGLNKNGINDWQEIAKIGLTNPDIVVLDTSYRQSPTLLAMSRQMYLDEMGKEAPFHSSRELASYDATPLKYVSTDEDEKIEWIANRIVEIYKARNDQMPSVAIFIGDKENIEDFVDTISANEDLDGIKVKDGTRTDVKKCVRVYHLSDVKGMEFEVAFFHNIDTAISQDNSGLMRRHLYVGISRAASHLAATFNKSEGNEDVLKYFDSMETHW